MCPAIYLTYGIVKSTIYEASANNFINEELDFNNSQVIDRKMSFEKKEIRVVLIGNEVPETEIATARDNLKHFNLSLIHIQMCIRDSNNLDAETYDKLVQIKNGWQDETDGKIIVYQDTPFKDIHDVLHLGFLVSFRIPPFTVDDVLFGDLRPYLHQCFFY